MGILDRFFNRFSTGSSAGWTFGGSQTASGEPITAENALNLSSVYAAINVKANAVAKLPLQVFLKENGSRKRNTAHQVAYLLETRPNPYMTPYLFKHTITVHRNIYGIAYVKMEFNRQGKVIALHLLDPRKVTIAETTDKKYYVEETMNKKNPNIYDEEEIIRLPYLTVDGFIPKSPITVARETIGTLKKQQKFLGSFYSNGTLTRGVLKVPTQLNKEAKDKIREAWMEANSGEDNASKIAVLDSGFEFDNITIPLQDAEFIASQKFGVEEIARIFNVPPHMIASLDKATFSNIEQQSLDFIQNTIAPEVIAWEEEMNYKLFTKGEQQKGLYVKFNLTSALRGDSQARANFYKTMIETGAYSINEVRELEEKDAIERGDIHRVDLNHVSIEIADEYQLARANRRAEEGGDK